MVGSSIVQDQHDIILGAIRNITRGDWKILVIDHAAKRILDNVVKEDDILNENIANIEMIEDRRDMNPGMDAIYLLTPQPHIVDCLMADFERRKYRRAFLIWTSLLDPQLHRRLTSSRQAQEQMGGQGFKTLSIDYYPSESHLVVFRDPWSFPMLFHPSCNDLVRDHMQTLAQRITGICVSLGEYPKVRYYRPRNPTHEASVLCSHLARFVQEELDAYAQWNQDFPPPSNRPPSVLLITDRTMDLAAPFVHEFTYQAMAYDLLPIREGDKSTYRTVINEGSPEEEEKDMEISEKDKIWVENRHQHMSKSIEKLMTDFKKFIADNPQFTQESKKATVNTIKDMMAGLPQFQEMKSLYSLHLNMAQDCMNVFSKHDLINVAMLEQTMATGLDEDYRKPKQVADQLVTLLDDQKLGKQERLRLIILYIMFRGDGLISEDIERLLAHSNLHSAESEVINNLDLLGLRITKTLKDSNKSPTPQPLLPKKPAPQVIDEEKVLSRYETNLQLVLEESAKGTLDQAIFPYTNPPAENSEELAMQQQTSLRSAKPTWARNRTSTVDSRQRIIVFMAGGATYSESRACYQVSRVADKDVFLSTSHMLTPSFFLRQVGDLSKDRRALDLPILRPKPKAPAYLFMRNDPSPPQPAAGPNHGHAQPSRTAMPASPARGHHNGMAPPTAAMSAMSVNPKPGRQVAPTGAPPQSNGTGSRPSTAGDGKEKGKDEKEKKKRHFFGGHKK